MIFYNNKTIFCSIVVFQDVGTSVFLCDFHREQAWERWTKKTEHGLNSEDRETLLHHLRSMAHAPRSQNPDCPFLYVTEAKAKLTDSEVYKKNVQVQSWLQGTWFPEEKRWASAYREHKIDIKINTNNGVEAQNKVFKHNYLSKGTDKTLSGVAKVIVESFCPDQYKLYMLKNLKLNRNIKAYNKEIPEFLHGRPHGFIKHCMQRIYSSALFSKKDIQDLGNLKFQVKSDSMKQVYDIDLSSPSCSCPDWKKFKCPCKHMFAVFENTSAEWSNLPINYRESSLYTADMDVEGMECSTDQHENREVHDIDKDNSENHTESGITPANSVPPTGSPTSGITEPTGVTQLPQKRKIGQNPLKHVANITRATLQQLKELTYLSQDTDILNNVTKELKSLIAKLSATVPKSNEGIYLHGSPQKNKKRNKRNTKLEVRLKLNNVGCIAKKKKSGKKRLDWWHRNRIGSRANMLKKFYKVNVPVLITVDDEENEESQGIALRVQSSAENWRNVYRSLLIPKEFECLNPGRLVNDLVIESFFR